MKRILFIVVLSQPVLYALEIKMGPKASITEIRNVEDANRTISSVLFPFFAGRDNILTNRITVEQTKPIYDFLTQVQKFITAKDKSLLPAYNIILSVTNDIINTV